MVNTRDQHVLWSSIAFKLEVVKGWGHDTQSVARLHFAALSDAQLEDNFRLLLFDFSEVFIGIFNKLLRNLFMSRECRATPKKLNNDFFTQ